MVTIVVSSAIFVFLIAFFSYKMGQAEERFKWHCKLKIGECDPAFSVMQCPFCGELNCDCENEKSLGS